MGVCWVAIEEAVDTARQSTGTEDPPCEILGCLVKLPVYGILVWKTFTLDSDKIL